MAFYNNVPLKNKNGDTYYPQSKTNSVYDDDTGERLDKILEKFFIIEDEGETTGAMELDADTLGGEDKEYFEELVQVVDDKVTAIKNPITGEDFGHSYNGHLDNFKELNKFEGINWEITHGFPVGQVAYGRVINIGLQKNVFNQYIFSDGGVTFVRPFTEWADPKWGNWTKIITTGNIVNTDTMGSSDTVPSSTVTHQLGQEIDSVTEIQIPITFISGVYGSCFKNQKTGLVKLVLFIDGYIDNSTMVGVLPSDARPTTTQLCYNVVEHFSGVFGTAVVSVDSNGNIILSARNINESMSGATFNFMYKI
jgi:hypothetical protein